MDLMKYSARSNLSVSLTLCVLSDLEAVYSDAPPFPFLGTVVRDTSIAHRDNVPQHNKVHAEAFQQIVAGLVA